MGDMAEYYMEQWWDEADEHEEYLPESPYMWKDASGKTMWISRMTPSHLANTMRYLERTNNTDIAQYAYMKKIHAKGSR